MKNTIKTFSINGIGNINVSATMRGVCNGTKQFDGKHYIYNLKIWSEKGKMSVTFHDSRWNYEDGIKKMDEVSLVSAMDCVISDISMYLDDSIRYCYDENEDSALIKSVTNGCKREYERFAVVVGGKDNVCSAIEELAEQISECYNNLN